MGVRNSAEIGLGLETGVKSSGCMMGALLKEELTGTQAQSDSRAICS